jgi:hypothetical protein
VASIDDIREWDGDSVGNKPDRSGRAVTTQMNRAIGRRQNPATRLAKELERATAALLRSR